MDQQKEKREKGEKNSLILSPKLEMLSLRSEEKLSIDAVSETVSEIDRAPPSASAVPQVNWKKTCRGKNKTTSEKQHLRKPITIISLLMLCLDVCMKQFTGTGTCPQGIYFFYFTMTAV